MPEARAPVLVLGLGNLLLSDDGFGLELLAEVRRGRGEDPRVEYLDGGTLGSALLGELEGREALLLLDAVGGDEPGELRRIDDPLACPSPSGLGGHGANASGLLGAASLLEWLPPRVAVVGATPACLQTRIGLSETLHAVLPAARALALATLDEMLASIDGGALCTS